MTEVKRFDSSEGNVWKYVFHFPGAIAEAVLYKYEEFSKRTVICVSVQSGCPVGCTFCGTGNQFIRNLTPVEIIEQVAYVLKDWGIQKATLSCENFQIMFMSMGEPMLNWKSVERAIRLLHEYWPSAQLLLSTVGINDLSVWGDLLDRSNMPYIGLQLSIHRTTDEARRELIPAQNILPLVELRNMGMAWSAEHGKKVQLNYCVVPGENDTDDDLHRLRTLFPPQFFGVTVSVVCTSVEGEKSNSTESITKVSDFGQKLSLYGYDVKTFNPAGQDDIGGGCGQLWYVQSWMRENAKQGCLFEI